MSKDELPYFKSNEFTKIDEAFLAEDYEFGKIFLDKNNTEQEAVYFEENYCELPINSSKKTYSDLKNNNNCSTSKQLALLQRLLHITNQKIHLSELVKEIAQEICDAIDYAEFCMIALYDSQTKELELIAKIGTNVDKLGLTKPEDVCRQDVECKSYNHLNLLNQVFATGVAKIFQISPVNNDNIGEKLSDYLDFDCPVISGFSPSCMYAVPISSPHLGRLGVLAIGNWNNPYSFDATSQKMLYGITDLIAIAINNARIRQTLEQQEEILSTQTAIFLEQQRELEKKQNTIEQQKLRLINATNHKSQFLATTSHELRTPLNVILGLSQVLLRQRNSTLTAQQADMVERILSNGNHLRDIIEDMLDFAKVEAGNLSLKLGEVNLHTLVLTTVKEHHALAIEKNLNLQTDININYPFVVNDSKFIQQILVKLLSNAIKFTETGGIVVKLWEISPDRVAIAVQDSGIGIAESDIEDIFEPLYQVDQSITRKYDGTGLGLAITKSFVELMQGTISLTSKIGEGSTFYIELPRQIAASV
jgi:signal transduction histidine kinase